MLGCLISIGAVIGIGYVTESVSMGIVAFFVILIIMMVCTTDMAGPGSRKKVKKLTSSIETLIDGTKKIKFIDGGIILHSLDGTIQIVQDSNMVTNSL